VFSFQKPKKTIELHPTNVKVPFPAASCDAAAAGVPPDFSFRREVLLDSRSPPSFGHHAGHEIELTSRKSWV